MPVIVNINEVKTNLSKLLVRVGNGEEVIISKGGKPIAKLVPIPEETEKRVPGSAKGKVIIEKNFDAPLSKNILKAFKR